MDITKETGRPGTQRYGYWARPLFLAALTPFIVRFIGKVPPFVVYCWSSLERKVMMREWMGTYPLLNLSTPHPLLFEFCFS